MSKIIFILLLLLASFTNASSQDLNRSYHRIGLLIGGQQTRLQDQQFSPLIHRANELSGQFRYNAKYMRDNWNASLDFSTGSLFPAQFADRQIYNTTEDIEGNITFDSVFIRGQTLTGNLQVGYDYSWLQTATWEVKAGPKVRNQIMYPSTFTNLGTMNSASLLINLEVTWYSGSKTEWNAGINTPVLGWNTRFPYSGTVSLPNQTLFEAFFDGGTHFVSFGDYQQVNANLAWRYQLSHDVGIGLAYAFTWQRYLIPVSFKSYSQRLGATVDMTF